MERKSWGTRPEHGKTGSFSVKVVKVVRLQTQLPPRDPRYLPVLASIA